MTTTPLVLLGIGILTVALSVGHTAASGALAHVLGVVVLLAVYALAPVGVATSVECTLALVQKKVVRPVGAQHEVLWSVIGLVFVYMMNLLGAGQVAAERTLDHPHVLSDLSPAWVACTILRNVSASCRNPAAPSRMLFTNTTNKAIAPAVATAESCRLTLYNALFGVTARSNGRWLAAPAHAQAGRIRHREGSALENIDAANITHCGGYFG